MEQKTRAGFRRGIRARLRFVPASAGVVIRPGSGESAGIADHRFPRSGAAGRPWMAQRRIFLQTEEKSTGFLWKSVLFFSLKFPFSDLRLLLFPPGPAGSRLYRAPCTGLPFFPAAGPVLLPGRRILRMPPAHRPRSVHSGPASFLRGPAGCTGPSGGTLQSARRRYSIALEMEPAFCRRDLLRRTGQIRTARGGEQRQPRRSSGPITERPRQLHLGSLPEAGQFFPAGTESSVRIPDLLSDSRSPLALCMRVRAGLPAGADLQLWRKAEPGMTGKGRSSSPGTVQTGG